MKVQSWRQNLRLPKRRRQSGPKLHGRANDRPRACRVSTVRPLWPYFDIVDSAPNVNEARYLSVLHGYQFNVACFNTSRARWHLDCSPGSDKRLQHWCWDITVVYSAQEVGTRDGRQLHVSLWGDVVQVRAARGRQGVAKG